MATTHPDAAPAVRIPAWDPVGIMLDGLPRPAPPGPAPAGPLTAEHLWARGCAWAGAGTREVLDAAVRLGFGPEAAGYRSAVARAWAAAVRGDEPDVQAVARATGELAALPARLALAVGTGLAGAWLAALSDLRAAAG